MLRYFFALFFIGVIAVLAVAGFRGTKSTRPPIQIFPDMDDQPKYRPQHENDFFADGREQRGPVTGTVPRGYVNPGTFYSTSASNSHAVHAPAGFSDAPSYADTGKIGDQWGNGFPIEVTPELLARGQERFNINCAVCHGPTGAGNGIVKQYGLSTIASMVDDRVAGQPDGEIFNTITNGKNTMNGYGSNLSVPDRWAILSYVRALQRSQRGTEQDVPPDEMDKLQEGAEQ